MERKSIAGIYYIKNIINGKIYIGQTNDIYYREKSHMSSFKKGKAVNDYLRKSIIKYGYENFKYKLLLKLPANRFILNIAEMFLIWLLNTRIPNGYNINKGGDNKNTQRDIKQNKQKKIIKRKDNQTRILKEKDSILWNDYKNMFYLTFPEDYLNKISNPTIEIYKYSTGNKYNLHIEYLTDDGKFSYWHDKKGFNKNDVFNRINDYKKIIPFIVVKEFLF